MYTFILLLQIVGFGSHSVSNDATIPFDAKVKLEDQVHQVQSHQLTAFNLFSISNHVGEFLFEIEVEDDESDGHSHSFKMPVSLMPSDSIWENHPVSLGRSASVKLFVLYHSWKSYLFA